VNTADPGLQPQRTALAWSRTALAVFVNAFLVLRTGMQSGQALTTALGVVLLVAGALTVGCGAWRHHALVRSHKPGGPPAQMVWAIVAVTWIACVAGMVSILSETAGG
jgi:uncharacterized membrane protein YidH (DUF202 family)